MAITPVQLPKLPIGMSSMLDTDFDRAGDRAFRYADQPVEIHRFTGDSSTTTLTVVTGLLKALGGMVFNMTDGTNWATGITVKPNASAPGSVDLASIPADADVYMLIVWGEANVPDTADVVNTIAAPVPDGLTAEADSATQITISWNAVEHINGLAVEYDYRVDGGSATDNDANTSKAVTSLTTATEYDFEVRSRVTDALGNVVTSAWSSVVSETTD